MFLTGAFFSSTMQEMGYLHSTDITGRAWGLLSVNWTHPLHIECRFSFMCPVLSVSFAFLKEKKNPLCFFTSYTLSDTCDIEHVLQASSGVLLQKY